MVRCLFASVRCTNCETESVSSFLREMCTAVEGKTSMIVLVCVPIKSILKLYILLVISSVIDSAVILRRYPQTVRPQGCIHALDHVELNAVVPVRVRLGH